MLRGRVLAVALGSLLVAGVLVAAGVARAANPTPYPGGRWAPSAATYGIRAVHTRFVTMTDGARIGVDIYYPTDRRTGRRVTGRRFPVLLSQTPYTGSLGAADVVSPTGPGAYFVERGYIYVAADVRGTGRSSGLGQFMGPREAQDGAELVTWAAALDGGNGVVGLHGCSYLGATQLYTAGALRPGTPVKAMIPACTKGDPYRDTYMVNGIHAPQWVGAGLFAGALLGPTIEAYMVPRFLDSQLGGDVGFDRSFWRARSHVLDAPAITRAGIATLLWNGWNDAGFGGLEMYTALQNAHFGRPVAAPLTPTTPVTGRYQLIVGNWGHGGGLDEGIQLQWYETWLKGVDTGLAVDTPTPLHVQEQVSGEWANLAAYPMTTRSTRLNLQPSGRLASSAAPESTLRLRWGITGVPGAPLAFETAPDADGATIAGPSALRLQVSSTATDLQLMADLYDVAPDGTATPISHGGALGSMRATDPAKSWVDAAGRPIRPYLQLTQRVPLVAGQPVVVDIPLRPTVWRLAPRHRLRLTLAGQEPVARCLTKMSQITIDAVGCWAPLPVQAQLAGATFSIRTGASFLNVPLLDPGGLGTIRAGRTPTTPASATLPLDW